MLDAHIGMGGLVLPLPNNGLGAEDKKGLGLEEVPSQRAIQVLKCHNKGQLLSRREVGVGRPDLGQHLGDLQSSVEGVVRSKRHVECCRGVDPTSRGGVQMEGDAIDKDLAPFDIGMDHHVGGT